MGFLRSAVVPCASAILVTLSAAVMPTGASAAPVPGKPAVHDGAVIVQVRGDHRTCQRHFVPRWGVTAPHRHVGPRNQPVACGNRWRGRGLPPRYRERGCFKLGPIWYCP